MINQNHNGSTIRPLDEWSRLWNQRILNNKTQIQNQNIENININDKVISHYRRVTFLQQFIYFFNEIILISN